ncbi:MAG: hypothetical protein KAQ66_12330 [Rhodospirillaceae bacterium]|nr:hypothetical protein [Rhodospirillaceae bacterium]
MEHIKTYPVTKEHKINALDKPCKNGLAPSGWDASHPSLHFQRKRMHEGAPVHKKTNVGLHTHPFTWSTPSMRPTKNERKGTSHEK